MTQNFYADLSSFSNFAEFTDLKHYQPLPADWQIVISDIVSSSRAIETGMYQAVNAISTASIVAVLNAIKPLSAPYVFGGDGATICIPAEQKDVVASALVAASQLARESFDLELRVGIVSMQTLQEQGYQLLIGKYQPSPHFQQAVFQGGGLQYAEKLIKQASSPYLLDERRIQASGSFEGFECRWNEIRSAQEETVALMIQALPQAASSENTTYTEVLQKIYEVYGYENDHHPLREENLSLTLSPMKLAAETLIRTAFQGVWEKTTYLLKAWLVTAIGKILMKNKVKTDASDWGLYKAQLVENTDYRKFDETLRMVLSGTQAQRQRLDAYLRNAYEARILVYGMHPSESAILTCVVFNYDTEHVHFLDGSNGGYAIAAQALKKQRAALQAKQH